MTFNTNVPNRNHYNGQMEKSLIDKIYFMDKVDGAEVFVDFGCANGVLLKTLSKMFPQHYYYGYDISEDMLSDAREYNPDNIPFTSNWEALVEEVSVLNKPTVLILSSIVHEIYSYLGKEEISKFWDRVWNSGFDYVVVRDMMVSRSTSRPSDPISVARIRQLYNPDMIAEWESHWGSLTENWSLVHFLLTYRYKENWSREVRENYLPISLEEFLPMIPPKYFPEHIEHYTLPFIRETVKSDFGIDLQDRTHLKLILKKT